MLGDRWRGDGLSLRARLGIQLQETKFPEKLRVSEVVTLFRSFYPRGLGVAEVLALVGLEEKAGAHVRRCQVVRNNVCRSAARWWETRSCSSRRANHRAVSTVAPPDVGDRGASQGARAHGAAHDALHGGGGPAVRPGRGRRSRQGDRAWDPTRAHRVARSRARHRVRRRDAAATAIDERILRGLPSVEDVASDGGSWRLTVREMHRAVPALLAALSERGADPTERTTPHAPLEDVCMALTGRRVRDG